MHQKFQNWHSTCADSERLQLLAPKHIEILSCPVACTLQTTQCRTGSKEAHNDTPERPQLCARTLLCDPSGSLPPAHISLAAWLAMARHPVGTFKQRSQASHHLPEPPQEIETLISSPAAGLQFQDHVSYIVRADWADWNVTTAPQAHGIVRQLIKTTVVLRSISACSACQTDEWTSEAHLFHMTTGKGLVLYQTSFSGES